MFPIIEKELYKRFIDTGQEGKWIKRSGFNTQAKRIMSETYPEHVETFKMSTRRFAGFCRSNKILLRRKTLFHKKLSNNFVSQYPNFTQKHWERERKRSWDTYASRGLADMVQTPLPFVLVDNKTYDKKGAEECG